MRSTLPPTHWSSLPPARPAGPPRRRWAPILVPGALVVGLWLVGWRELAVVVAVVATVVTLTAAAVPAVRHTVERVAAAVGRWVGAALTFVLLALVQLVIFTPVSFLARILRTDPLDPLARRPVDSRWMARSRTRPLPDRPYADEGYRRAAATPGGAAPVGSPRWIRGAVGGVVLLLAADVAIGSLVVWLDGDDDPAPGSDGPVFGFDPAAQEALATQERGRELMAELGRVGIGDPDPFLGWRFGPGVTHASDLVNVVDGLRRTALPPTDRAIGSDDGAAPPREVWFFGGSTMYGSGQRDDATIPSVLVGLLAVDGIAVRATNFGHPAYANWQQIQLLEEELTAGTRPAPDLVVFYDGFNDLTLQTQFGVHTEPTHLFFDPIRRVPVTTEAGDGNGDRSVAATVRTWWADHSAVALAVGRVRDAFDDEATIRVADVDAAPIDTIDPAAAGEAAAALHRRGVDHVTALAEAYDFAVRFFWQPYLYTRDPLTPAEQELVGLPGYDTDVWLPMTERVRAELAPPVIDLSDALDGEPSSLFWDFVHTNERGGALLAEAMRAHLVEALTGTGP